MIRWQRRDVDIEAKCMGVTFSLTGDNGAGCFKGVDDFKYLGQVLHRTENDCLAVLRNICRVRQVWGRLGKLLRREGAYLISTEKFYQAVVQAVQIFEKETWVMLAAMLKKIEGVNMGFLLQVMGMKA